MKAAPTLEGGLRIDTEDLADWEVLFAIAHDANRAQSDLASELGSLITEEAVAEDWKEFVVPDLRDEFENQLGKVAATIQSAMEKCGGGNGSVWISKSDGFIWYGALNQARLSIEDEHHFGPRDNVDMENLPPAMRSAFIRSQFYLGLQSLLLDYVLG